MLSWNRLSVLSHRSSKGLRGLCSLCSLSSTDACCPHEGCRVSLWLSSEVMCKASFRLSIDSNAERVILHVSVTGTQGRSQEAPCLLRFGLLLCVFISPHGILVGCECVGAPVLTVIEKLVCTGCMGLEQSWGVGLIDFLDMYNLQKTPSLRMCLRFTYGELETQTIKWQ